MKRVLISLLGILILTGCQTTKLSNLNNTNTCYVAVKSDISETITAEEAELIKKYFSEPTKLKLKFPQLAKKVLGCLNNGD